MAVVHLFSNRLRFLDGTPRSIWLSIAGGISVAYVFIHLLPELAEGQETVTEALDQGEGLAFLESHVYLVALVGLAVFYGLQRLAALLNPGHHVRMRAYSEDLRTKIVEAVQRGMGQSEAARSFGVNLSSVKRYVRAIRKGGTLRPKKHPGSKPKIDERGRRLLEADVEQRPTLSLLERCRFLGQATGMRVSVSTMSRVLRRLGFSRKKRSVGASERDEWLRAAWRVIVAEQIDARRLVFVDEMGANTSLAPLYAWARRGKRAWTNVPRNRGPNTTLLASMTHEGMGPCVAVEGTSTSAVFEAYVEQVLVPTLHPGQVVVLDNLTAHKGERVRELVERRGCELIFLPPYSPDLNPIEEAFSKIKALLRRAEARGRDALVDAIGGALSAVTAQDARGSFGHCGYAVGGHP